MRKRAVVTIFFAVVALLIAAPAAAKIIYVKSNATGADTGESWANACNDLRSALSSANSGDQIWVAAGTYKPTAGADRTQSFTMAAGVAIYGGFAGAETVLSQRNWTSNPTILSGNIGSTTTKTDNSFHVLVGASQATLDGFTVSNGNATSKTLSFNCGAGLYCNRADGMTVANCTFRNNSATSGGAAVYNNGHAQSISFCAFSGNSVMLSSYSTGGTVYNSGDSQTIAHCTFSGNSIDSTSDFNYPGGGAIYNIGASQLVANCAFNDNFAKAGGGAIFNDGNFSAVTNCSFVANSAGAGAGIDNSGTSQTVFACAFSRNAASMDGGAILNFGTSQTLLSCAFEANYAIDPNGYGGSGGAIANYSYPDQPQFVTQCAFTRNFFAYHGGAIFSRYDSPIVARCTFTDNYATGALHNGGITLGGAICGLKQAIDCVFTGNSAESCGAVITGARTQFVTGCSFQNNSAKNAGALGMYCPIAVSNCVFAGNSATENGGAVAGFSTGQTGYSIPGIAHCTFHGNTAGTYGGAFCQSVGSLAIGTTVTNCVFWGNSAKTGPDIYKDSGVAIVKHCDLSDWNGSQWNDNFGVDGGGNIDADPLFVGANNPAGADALMQTADDGLRLKSGSPCIDTGLSIGAPATDILGNPRSSPPDIGAYEFIPYKNRAARWTLYD